MAQGLHAAEESLRGFLGLLVQAGKHLVLAEGALEGALGGLVEGAVERGDEADVMHGLLGVREERQQVGDALGLGDGSVQSRQMERQGCLGADGVTTVEGVVADADNEAEVGKNFDEGLLAQGGDIREVVNLGVLGALLEPVGNLLVGDDFSVASVVGVNERREEGLVGVVDLIGVVEEGEVLEWIFAILVDKTAGLQVVMEVSSLVAAFSRPNLSDVVTATFTSSIFSQLRCGLVLLTQHC